MGGKEMLLMNEVEFRVKVLSGIDGLQREFKSFAEAKEKQISELFDRVNTVETDGCAHSPEHRDHDTRLRAVEQRIAVITARPALVPVHSNDDDEEVHTKFSFLKIFSFDNFRAADIIVIIAVIVFGIIAVVNHADSKKLSQLEVIVTKLAGDSK